MTIGEIREAHKDGKPVWLLQTECQIHGIGNDICDVSLISDYGSSFALSYADACCLLSPAPVDIKAMQNVIVVLKRALEMCNHSRNIWSAGKTKSGDWIDKAKQEMTDGI